MGKEILGRPAFHFILITLLGLTVYANTFDVPFHIDDEGVIVNNPTLKEFSHFIDFSQTKKLSTSIYRYESNRNFIRTRYMSMLSFWANYSLGGLRVEGYHFVNLVIHVINALLLYSIVTFTFRTPIISNSCLKEKSKSIAFISGLLFVCHPIQTQAVTYIVQRFASLATMFYLLSLLLYIVFRLKGKRLFLLFSVVSAVFAMNSKEIAFTLPVMVAIYEIVFFKDLVRRRLLYLIPLFCTMSIIPLNLMATGQHKKDVSSDLSFEVGQSITEITTGISKVFIEVSSFDYFLMQFKVITTYIRLLFMPIGQSIYYEEMLHFRLSEPSMFLSFPFLLSIFGIGVYLLYRSRITDHGLRLISFGIFWFFLALSVESSIIPLYLIYEHRVYLPSAGAFMAIVPAMGLFAVRFRISQKFVVWAAVAAVITFSGATYARNTIWQSKVSLWEDTVKKAPGDPYGHYFLGKAYDEGGLAEKALDQYEIFIALQPDFSKAHYIIAEEYFSKGMTEKATEHYLSALKLEPGFSDAYINLGSVYMAKGMTEDAIEQYKAALKFDPDSAEANNNLGGAYMAKGMIEDAIEQYNRALEIDSSLAEAYVNLGKAYLKTGDIEKAEDEFLTALNLMQGDASFYSFIGSAYVESQYPDKAIEYFEAALDLNSKDAFAHNNIGAAYQSKGMVNKAIEHYRAAAELEPGNPTSYYNLGFVYQSQGLIDNAIQLYQIALEVAPNYAAAHNNLGGAYYSKGMADKAVEHYRTALGLAPDNAQVHYNLGLVYLEQGLRDDASGQFEAALRIDPGYIKARESLERLNKKQ